MKFLQAMVRIEGRLLQAAACSWRIVAHRLAQHGDDMLNFLL